MNLFMLCVQDEKEGYAKVKKDELMEALSLIYDNGFEDGKRAAETRQEIKSGTIHLIGASR